MRQSGDQQYADLLSNLRVRRMTEEHYNMLQTRFITGDGKANVQSICQTYKTLANKGQSPLILMPKTTLCDEVNVVMLNEINTTIHRITAVDTLDTIVDRRLMKKVQQAYDKSEEDVTRTVGLEKHLQLCVGCKVMLKRNKNVEAGLVNGLVGTVTSFNTTTQGNITLIDRIAVKFDKIDNIVNIKKDSASFEVLKSIYYTRKQFPLMLAFAITIHKSQGLSLQTAIVDAGSSTFRPGMTYVALSQVTSLTGLHLVAFDRSKVACDQKAVKEYNRLRRLYTPQLVDLISVNKSCTESRKRKKTTKEAEADQQKRKKPRTKTKQTAGKSESHQQQSAKRTVGINIFDCCNVQSVDELVQTTLCTQMNLTIFPQAHSEMSPSHKSVARQLEQHTFAR